MHYYIDVLKKYAVFTGRARRAEFWYFYLFDLLIPIVLFAVYVVIFLIVLKMGNVKSLSIKSVMYPIRIILNFYSLMMIIPSLAVTIRRLHDTGRSGWFLLLFMAMFSTPLIVQFAPILFFLLITPLVGFIWFLIILCTDSYLGENMYGPNPKGQGSVDSFIPSAPVRNEKLFVNYQNQNQAQAPITTQEKISN